jgi:hypothetical protein
MKQEESTYWKTHKGNFKVPDHLGRWQGYMCPSGLALHHLAASHLLQYATEGCPSNTGRPWTVEQMQDAIDRGPHMSALVPEDIEQLAGEIAEKVKIGQCRAVLWEEFKDNPPEQLKISPIAMIPHKSRLFWAILDLSFKLRLQDGGFLESVNASTMLWAPVER